MSLHSFSQFDLTTLTLCNSIFDSSDDPIAIKFMRMAPELFPQFIHSNNRDIAMNTNNSNHSIPHQSDTDTTQSNETVIYSQDDIKAAQQLLNMHSFTMHQNGEQMDNKSIINKQCLSNNKAKNDRRKHPRKFKTINNCKSDNINLNIDMISTDLQCIDDNFCLYSESISNLDSKLKRKQMNLNELLSAHNILPFKCDYIGCHTLFKTKSLLVEHVKNEHNSYLCLKCKNMYDRVIELNNHKCSSKRRHRYHKEKPFKCKHCDKEFSSKGNLKKHGMVHDGERRFYCKFCNKGYIQKWRCKRHQKQCLLK